MILLIHPLTVAIFALVTGAALFAHRAHEKGSSPALISAGTAAFLTGIISCLSMLGHLTAVTFVRSVAESVPDTSTHFIRIGTFVYDFRFYSLMLLGILVLIPGMYCLTAALGATRGEYCAQKRILYASAVILGTTLPLVPIQPGAALLAGLAATNLLTLAFSRTSYVEETFAPGEDWMVRTQA